jgi:hypothetical protein
VGRGFLDIYPGQAFPPHLQSLVSGYATYQACGIESVNARAFIRTYEDRERIWCLAGMHEVNILELRFWTARRSVVDRLDETERRVRAGVHRICDYHATMRKRYFSKSSENLHANARSSRSSTQALGIGNS